MDIEELKRKIKELAYTKEQEDEALKIINEKLPLIKKMYSYWVYNKETYKELVLMTVPDLNIRIKFMKI